MPYCFCEMNINGRGVLMVSPDIALVNMGVITENKNLKAAQDENSTVVSNVIKELIKQGIPSKDIQTIDYNIEEQYDNIEGKQIFRSYRIRNTFRITVRDIKRVGEIIDSAVAKGANLASGVSFQVANPDKYYNTALEKALEQAVYKAQVIKNASRILLNTTPIRITEESTNYLPVYDSMSLKSAATPINPGEIQISASIRAVFQYTQY